MSRMTNFGKSKYGTANDGGGPYTKSPQTNYGGKMTKLGGGKATRQMNYNIRMKTPSGFEKGQGQRAGTGSQGGY